MAKNKNLKVPPKGRNLVHQALIQSSFRSGEHRDKTKYTRKNKHKGDVV